MPALLRWFLLFFLVWSSEAFASLSSARQAQSILGPDVWSRVIKIENRRQLSVYPTTTYGLVFEFNAMLWFYTRHNGTQSISMYAGHLEQDKRNLLPLLQDIEPGFARYEIETRDLGFKSFEGPLPNGCFVESLAAFRSQLAHGEPLRRASLLLYYSSTAPGAVKGHTVLVYETSQGTFVFDPARGAERPIRAAWPSEPLAFAKLIEPTLRAQLVQARCIPLKVHSEARVYAANLSVPDSSAVDNATVARG
jgi:hypothetical protein